jgi:predicted nucleic acid-binding Zn ribbon protein
MARLATCPICLRQAPRGAQHCAYCGSHMDGTRRVSRATAILVLIVVVGLFLLIANETKRANGSRPAADGDEVPVPPAQASGVPSIVIRCSKRRCPW